MTHQEWCIVQQKGYADKMVRGRWTYGIYRGFNADRYYRLGSDYLCERQIPGAVQEKPCEASGEETAGKNSRCEI